MKKYFKKDNIANIITLSRSIIIPLLVYVIISNNNLVFVFTLVLGIFLDYFDGYIARKLKITSDLGRKLDSFFDALVTNGEVVVFLIFFKDEFFSNLEIVIPWTLALLLSDWIKQGVSYYFKKSFFNLHLWSVKLSSVPMFVFFFLSLLNNEIQWLWFYITILAVIISNLEAIFIYFRYKQKTNENIMLFWKNEE